MPRKKSTHNNRNVAVIIGAAVSGLTAAAALAREYKDVVILERCSKKVFFKKLNSRDRHAHVCVASAFRKYTKIFPNFEEKLKKNGFFTGDPGKKILWGTASGFYPRTETYETCGFGSYYSFAKTIYESVEEIGNIKIFFSSKVNSLDSKNNTISYNFSENRCLQYDLLVCANGVNSNSFMINNNIELKSEIFSGSCNYISLGIKLEEPLRTTAAFISEASPGEKNISLLYVPRSNFKGILTIGNFEKKELNLENVRALKEELSKWKNVIPSEFLQKVSDITYKESYKTKETIWNKIDHKKYPNIYMVGDSLLRVPPYTGLGLAVTLESIQALLAHKNSLLNRTIFNFDVIFRKQSNEIFKRVLRYQKHWGKEQKGFKRNYSFFPKKISKFFSKLIFDLAFNKQSPEAARFLFRRFHLVKSDSSISLIWVIFRAKIGLYKKRTKNLDGKIHRTYKQNLLKN